MALRRVLRFALMFFPPIHGFVSDDAIVNAQVLEEFFGTLDFAGKSPRNRDHEAHCSINFCSSLERRPRCLGGCQRGGGT